MQHFLYFLPLLSFLPVFSLVVLDEEERVCFRAAASFRRKKRAKLRQTVHFKKRQKQTPSKNIENGLHHPLKDSLKQ